MSAYKHLPFKGLYNTRRIKRKGGVAGSGAMREDAKDSIMKYSK